MITPRNAVPALFLAASFAACVVEAADPPQPPPEAAGPTAGPAAGPHHWEHGAGMLFVLHRLDLTPDQRTRVAAIMAQHRDEFEALRTGAKANRHALATTPPTDPAYPALVETAQTAAAKRIKLESETWAAVYSGVLTPGQQQAIPGIVAAVEQERAARESSWKARREAAAAPLAD